MRNLPFVLWVLLFPACMRLNDYLGFLMNGSVAENLPAAVRAPESLINFVVWVLVAFLVYEEKPKTRADVDHEAI